MNRFPYSGFASRIALLLCAITAGAALAAPPSKQQWSIAPLPGLADGSGSAEAVNNRGDIVGSALGINPEIGGPNTRAVLWQNGTVRDLGSGVAFDVNHHGTIAGSVAPTQQSLWKDGAWHSLGVGTPGFPIFVNKSETVASSYLFVGGPPHAFIVENGVQRDLGTLGGTESQVRAINDRGQVVGYSQIAGDGAAHAFLYEDGVMQDLGTLGKLESQASDINDHGVVVGFASDRFGGAPIAFIHDGATRALFPGAGFTSVATGINNRREVVGVIDGLQAFHYEDGVLTLLQDLAAVRAAGWRQLIPKGINDRGWIVGMGIRNTPVPPGADPWRPFVLKRER